MTFKEAKAKIEAAKTPEALFGPDEDEVASVYRVLARAVHPDLNAAEKTAKAVFQALQRLHEEANGKLSRKTYGKSELTVTTKANSYLGVTPLAEAGDICDLFWATRKGSQVIIKVATSSKDNDLVQSEAKTLAFLKSEMHSPKDEVFAAYLPALIESTLIEKRAANIFEVPLGYFGVSQIMKSNPNGLDPRDAAWMLRRVIEVLTWVNLQGILHGAVLPEHVFVHPVTHGAVLLDWCYATKHGERLKTFSADRKDFYPKEVFDKKAKLTAAVDVFMWGKLAVYLHGGNVETGELPASVPSPIRSFLKACTLPSPHARFQDLYDVYQIYTETLRKLYGKPTYRPFTMPA